ncbi:MAG: plastocyanin/azurin family copper-binding protein [bacterium]
MPLHHIPLLEHAAAKHLRVLLLASALAACGADYTRPSDAPPIDTPPAGVRIDATPALAFTPGALTVTAGDTVSFAFGTVPHNVFFATVAGAPLDIEGRNSDVVTSRVFTTPGTYSYECHIHPGMRGTVTVASRVSGVFILTNAEGAPLPARVDHVTGPTDTLDVYVDADTVTLAADGTYRQAAFLRFTVNGQPAGNPRWLDRGRFTTSGQALHGESERLEGVTLDAVLLPDGTMRITQDIVRNGTSARYVLRRVGATGACAGGVRVQAVSCPHPD